MSRGARPDTGGGALLILNPIPLGAIALLVINDHLLKAAWPGWVTGKLSDIAGLIFFPLLVHGLLSYGMRRASHPLLLVAATAVTAVGFCVTKVWEPANTVARDASGLLQWPVRAALAVVASEPSPRLVPTQLTMDASDLLALPALLVPLLVGLRANEIGLTAPRLKRVTAAGVLVLASVASVATTPAIPGDAIEDTDAVTVELTAERPFFERNVTVHLDHAPLDDVELESHANLTVAFDRDSERVPLRVSVLPEDEPQPIRLEASQGNVWMARLFTQDFAEETCAAMPCDRRFRVLVELAEAPGSAEHIAIRMSVTGSAFFSSRADIDPDGFVLPDGAQFEVAVVGDSEPGQALPSLVGTHAIDFRLTDAAPTRSVGVQMTVNESAADALGENLRSALLRVRIDIISANDSRGANVGIGLRGAGIVGGGPEVLPSLATGVYEILLGPFESCDEGAPCTREVILDLSLGESTGERTDLTASVEFALESRAAPGTVFPDTAEITVEDLCATVAERCEA